MINFFVRCDILFGNKYFEMIFDRSCTRFPISDVAANIFHRTITRIYHTRSLNSPSRLAMAPPPLKRYDKSPDVFPLHPVRRAKTAILFFYSSARFYLVTQYKICHETTIAQSDCFSHEMTTRVVNSDFSRFTIFVTNFQSVRWQLYSTVNSPSPIRRVSGHQGRSLRATDCVCCVRASATIDGRRSCAARATFNNIHLPFCRSKQ